MHRHRYKTRTSYSLPEKFAMVQESMRPNATAKDVARKYGITPRTLYVWRKMYSDVSLEELLADGDPRVADLKLQIQKLEAILGQRTYEIALLKERLDQLHSGDNAP